MIEITDVIFAVDSVPAILSISSDRFILFLSNALAILGLRALYFLLEAVRDRLVYLPKGLGIILFYVGVKMIVSEWVHIDPFISLAVILGLLTITVVACRFGRPAPPPTSAPEQPTRERPGVLARLHERLTVHDGGVDAAGPAARSGRRRPRGSRGRSRAAAGNIESRGRSRSGRRTHPGGPPRGPSKPDEGSRVAARVSPDAISR
ncbi:MAG: hypothetical protein V9G12_19570 [Microthrixaceae bacterium]